MRWLDRIRERVATIPRQMRDWSPRRSAPDKQAEAAKTEEPVEIDAAVDVGVDDFTAVDEGAAVVEDAEVAESAEVVDVAETPEPAIESQVGREPAPLPDDDPRKPFQAIGKVARIERAELPKGAPPRPVITVTGAPGPTGGPDYVGVSHLDRLQARAPIPGAVRNMHRLGAAPLAHVPATFRAAEATDTEIWGEPARELGDDLFSHVACVINLKLRQSAAPVLTETTELDPEEPAETEPQE